MECFWRNGAELTSGWGGEANHTHYGHESSTDVTVIPEAAGNPILNGVDKNFHAKSWLYTTPA